MQIFHTSRRPLVQVVMAVTFILLLVVGGWLLYGEGRYVSIPFVPSALKEKYSCNPGQVAVYFSPSARKEDKDKTMSYLKGLINSTGNSVILGNSTDFGSRGAITADEIPDSSRLGAIKADPLVGNVFVSEPQQLIYIAFKSAVGADTLRSFIARYSLKVAESEVPDMAAEIMMSVKTKRGWEEYVGRKIQKAYPEVVTHFGPGFCIVTY